MENRKQTSFTFVIDNLWEKDAVITSRKFLSGGYEWFVKVYPKGRSIEEDLAVFLCVANPESLGLGWKIRASNSFVLLNQSGKELYRMHECCNFFCAKSPQWGKPSTLPLKELKEKGVLEENKLIVKFQVKVVKVFGEGDVTGKEMFNVSGFQVLYSQVNTVTRLFQKHPDIAVNFIPTNQLVKTTYMNILLGLIETLDKPPHSFTETELANALIELNELTEVGFKLEWLERKLPAIFFEYLKADPNTEVALLLGLKVHIANQKVDHLIKEAKDWLKGVVHSWNEWKVRQGFVGAHNEKID